MSRRIRWRTRTERPAREHPDVLESPDAEPQAELSSLRVSIAVLLAVVAIVGAFFWVKSMFGTSAASQTRTEFAPYVDVTLQPTYQFQSPSNDPARQSVLGFVVAASSHSCTPSWGTYYSPSQANERIALGARIAQLHGYGASVMVSFGGARNTSLAIACPSADDLAKAYQSIIDTYDLRAIDLDVEGAALNNFAAEQRRAAAVRILQERATKAHRKIDIWLTLPVEPSGLTGNALSVLTSMLHARVHLAGINVMAMNFTHSPNAGATMLNLVERSLESTASQLGSVLPRYGINLQRDQIWRRLGVTVMIGQNDIAGERFTVANAQGLTSFAKARGLERLSMWSINRDQSCGAGFRAAVLSTTCSGTTQSTLEFTKIFSVLRGSLGGRSSSEAKVLRPIAGDKNPANAPFPFWNPTADYVSGYKVVENGEIYQAKWYNSGQDPAAQYQYSWQSPWELLGPVLPTDHAPVIASPPPGTYPQWSATTVYVAGRRVLYKGLPYVAKWSNVGVAPGLAAVPQASSPWKALYTIPGEPTVGN